MPKMPPPSHGVAIVIAAHPAPGKEKMPPPGMKMPDDPEEEDEDGPEKDKDGKVAPENAGVVRDDQHCSDCKNYSGDTGECSKVSGNFAPSDGCADFFEAVSGEDEPDADDTEPDADSDDQTGMPPQA